ncbi:MAG TPA: ATP-binding protein, partial [Chitinophagaceae bacterium]|nr:ATP-binding protein [Chitinophagaceae bacterium]
TKRRLWVGSEGQGLLLFDANSGKVIKRLTDADGLCNNAILNIEEDEAGCLWLSTFNGLSRYNPQTNEFKNYYQSDGLQSNQFSYRAALKLTTGEMAFGGINGFNIFRPGKITVRNYMPPLFITSILINNKPVTKERNFISSSGGAGISELKVPYDQAVLSFGFNALEYTAPDKIMYSYYLQGWDKDWNYSGNIRNINYNNIGEGSYTLHIKNTNANGEWNARETLLSVIILPPWYRSWWAYLGYITIAMGIFYAIYRYRVEKSRLMHKIALAQVNAEKEREINESRQSFFTNITHEFRTPLTLIINPLKDILEEEEEGRQKTSLNFMYRHARRLLSLVDQLLLFRKTESDTGQLHLSQFDLAGFSREVFLYFSQEAKAKNISYRFECDSAAPEIVADKEKLEIILFNLLSNALKYTPGGGEVILRIEEKPHDIIISVTDTGRGIPAGTGDLLFEKYYRVNQPADSRKPGFGIGLYLVKQFVDKHKGHIAYSA